jgi:uncharacterized membrane protein
MTDFYATLIVLFTAVIVFTLSKIKTHFIEKILDWIPPILFAYIIPPILVQLFDINVEQITITNWSKNILVPLAILMVMTTLTFRQLRLVGWKPIAVFLSGSFWIALFPVIYYLLFFKGSDSKMLSMWQGIPPIVGSWIGGSTSQIVLKEIAKTPEALFLTVLILDNILVNLWTIMMFQVIKNTSRINLWLNIENAEINLEFKGNTQNRVKNPYFGIGILVLISFGSYYLPLSFIQKIIFLSIIGMLLSSFFDIWDQKIILKYSHVIIILIMAILGLKLNFNYFSFNGVFLLFLIIWLISHFIFMIFVAKTLNVNAVWVPIASMANVGGIATTPAVTATYRKELMPHAVILAILSMVSGTAWGMITIWLFEVLVKN